MAESIRPSQLPPGTPGNTAAVMFDSGVQVSKSTPLALMDAARPLASQADAETGTDNAKIVSPLRVKQAIDALGVSSERLSSSDNDKGATLVNFEPYQLEYTTAAQAPVPMNVYQPSGEAGRTARQLFKPANRGLHIGEQFSGYGIEARPTGSGANGPANADFGFNVSVIKVGTAVGEIDGMNITVRQAGIASDACAILTDVAGWNGGTGFWGQHEGSTKHIDIDGTVLLDIRTQMGIIDTVNDSSFGFFATPPTGIIDHGLLFITEVTSGKFVDHITAFVNGRTAFQVDDQGRTYVNASDLGTAQWSRQECYVLEAATGNAIQGHLEFNRYAGGSDWRTTELRLRGSVDNADVPATSPWMAFRGRADSTSEITFGYGVGAAAYDRITIPIGGGLRILPLPSDPVSQPAGTFWFNSTDNQWKFMKNGGVAAIVA